MNFVAKRKRPLVRVFAFLLLLGTFVGAIPAEFVQAAELVEEPALVEESEETDVSVTAFSSYEEVDEVLQPDGKTRLFVVSAEVPEHQASEVKTYDDTVILSYDDADLAASDYETLSSEGYLVEYDCAVSEEVENEGVASVSEQTDASDVAQFSSTEESLEENVEEKIEETAKDREVIVALLDSKVCESEPDLAGRLVRYDEGEKAFVETTEEVVAEGSASHGTHMADILSTSHKPVKIYPYDVFTEDQTTVGAVYLAMEDAISKGVDVINLSLSGLGESRLLEKAVADAKEAGIFVVGASGNDRANTADYIPANVADVLTVSAVNEYGEITDYTNTGAEVDFSAVGSYAYDEEVESGTSYAAATVSAALSDFILFSGLDKESPDYYDTILSGFQSLAEDKGVDGWDEQYGYGVISVDSITEEAVQTYLLSLSDTEDTTEETASENPEETDDSTIVISEEDLEDAAQTLDTAGHCIRKTLSYTIYDIGEPTWAHPLTVWFRWMNDASGQTVDQRPWVALTFYDANPQEVAGHDRGTFRVEPYYDSPLPGSGLFFAVNSLTSIRSTVTIETSRSSNWK